MSYSNEQVSVIKDSIEWTAERIELIQIEASKGLYREDTDKLRSYSFEWGCIFDTVNLKLQELRAAEFLGDYSKWYKNQMLLFEKNNGKQCFKI